MQPVVFESSISGRRDEITRIVLNRTKLPFLLNLIYSGSSSLKDPRYLLRQGPFHVLSACIKSGMSIAGEKSNCTICITFKIH